MLKKLLLPLIFLLLFLGFWMIPNFKEIAAGVAILLFGMIALENGFKAFTEGPLKRLLANGVTAKPNEVNEKLW